MNRFPLLLLPVLVVSLAACSTISGNLTSEKPQNPESQPATAAPEPTAGAPQDIGSMLSIPAGMFQMGCDPANNGGVECNDKNGVGADLHTITLDAYLIDKYEVTNGSYIQCVAAGACSAPSNTSSPSHPSYYDNPIYADYPVMYIDWNQASAYCAWAGKRLPTEAEWEKAGRGSSDTRLYPWGDEPPTCTLANFGGRGGCVGDTSQVGSHPAGASPYGVQDMAGNVREWVADWWYNNYSVFSSLNNPLGPVSGDYKISRGGDWDSTDVRVDQRGDPRTDLSPLANPVLEAYTGFRCAAPEGVPGDGKITAGMVAIATATPAFSVAAPESGMANGVGRVLWNDQPVAGAVVNLCKGITSGALGSSDCRELVTSKKTNDQGVYNFLNIPPSQYVVLINVIDTNHWFFFTRPNPNQDFISGRNSEEATPFEFSPNQTLVLPDMTIYKFDLKQTSPEEEDVIREIPTLTWQAYPGAAYYGVKLGYGSAPAEKILTNSLKLTTLLQNCEYPWKVEAYNSREEKISEAWNWSSFYLVGQISDCVVQLNAPAAGSQIQAGRSIQFSWKANAMATDYEIYISSSPNPFTRVNGPTYTLEQGLPAGSHDWRITAFKNNEEIASSDYGHFEVVDGSLTPNAPENPAAATPASSQDIRMVVIPAGPFQMGGNKCMVLSGGNCLKWVPGDDDPPHSVNLDAYKIDAAEVTNAQYAACESAGMCRKHDPGNADTPGAHYGISSYGDYPITGVTWYDARAYCTWRGGRLPSEAEWEKAARGGLAGKMYPWGDTAPVCTPGAKNGAQTGSCKPSDSIAAATYAGNAFGLFDMSGNVAEWVNDWYQADYYSLSPASNPTGPDSGDSKVVRGGSYEGSHSFRGSSLNVYVRGFSTPTFGSSTIGFRCAADAVQ